MSKKHDERKDLASIARVGKVDYGNKLITVNKNDLGIHRLGMIDFLTHYCGWFVSFSNSVKKGSYHENDSSSSEAKKQKKEHKLKDKRK